MGAWGRGSGDVGSPGLIVQDQREQEAEEERLASVRQNPSQAAVPRVGLRGQDPAGARTLRGPRNLRGPRDLRGEPPPGGGEDAPGGPGPGGGGETLLASGSGHSDLWGDLGAEREPAVKSRGKGPGRRRPGPPPCTSLPQGKGLLEKKEPPHWRQQVGGNTRKHSAADFAAFTGRNVWSPENTVEGQGCVRDRKMAPWAVLRSAECAVEKHCLAKQIKGESHRLYFLWTYEWSCKSKLQ